MRFPAFILVLILSVPFFPRPASSQEVFGSIEGSAEPGTRVNLAGTSFGATADALGRFEIRLVPAGLYQIQLAAGNGSRDIRVRAGSAAVIDLRAGRPADYSELGSSRTVLSGAEIRAQSVDDPRAALTAAPGVTLRLGSIGVVHQVPLVIRGDRAGQPAVWLDGAAIRVRTTGDTRPLSARGLEEASVTTGSSGVAFGDNRGGVVGYVSRIGGTRLAGSFRAESDQPFGSGLGVGYNRFEGDLGGRIGGSNVRWFVSATLQGQGSSYRGLGAADEPILEPAGIDSIIISTPAGGPQRADTLYQFVEAGGIRQPLDWSSLRTLHGRLLYTFGGGASLSLTAVASDLDERFYPGTNILARSLRRGAAASSRLLVLNWGQPLSRTLNLQANVSIAGEADEAGPLAPASEAGSRDPALGIHLGGLEFTAMDLVPAVDDAYIKRLHNNLPPLVPYQDSNQFGNGSFANLSPYAIGGWPTQGLTTTISRIHEKRLTARVQAGWTPAQAHQLVFGAELDRVTVDSYQASLVSAFGLLAFTESPRRLALFAGDQMDLAGLQLDVGLRLERYSGNGLFPRVPGRIFTHPQWIPDTSAAVYAGNLGRVFGESGSHTHLLPRFAASYRLSERTTLRAGFGMHADPPSYAALFANKHTDLAFAGFATPFGRDIKFGTGSLLEFGYRRTAARTALDISVYRNRIVSYVYEPTNLFDPFRNENTVLQLLDDRDAVASGVDVGLSWRPEERLTATVAYSFSRFERVSSDAQLDHAVHASAGIRILRSLNALVTLRVMTNAYYTRLQNSGTGTLAPGGFTLSSPPIEPPDASRLPLVKLLDARLTHAITTGGRRFELFADVRNLLNTRNLGVIFAETGDENNASHRETILDPHRVSLSTEAESRGFLNPDNSVDLQHDCSGWVPRPASCVALQAVERRFGDGDGLYTVTEQERALNAFYDSLFGPSRLRLPGRTIRVGLEIR